MKTFATKVSIVPTTKSPSHSTTIARKSKLNPSECKICGAPAGGMNFGVFSCFSCKMFFKRNAETRQGHFQCHYDGHCKVDMHKRRICTCCRLKKCFASGMRIEFLRCSRSTKSATSRERHVSTTSITVETRIENEHLQQTELSLGFVQEEEKPEENPRRESPDDKLPTSSVLCPDKSSLSSSQWTLLGNLVHSYDESKLLLLAQRLINEDDVFQLLETNDPTLLEEFFREIYETSGAYLRSNRDLCTLLPENRSNFLRNAAESVTCLGSVLVWSQSQSFSCRPFLTIFENVYGKCFLSTIQHVMKLIDPDFILVKLALSLFAFSANSSVFSPNVSIQLKNSSSIFHIQNTYIEVTWKYLLYKYGQYEAVVRFNNLIQCLLAATVSMSNAQSIPTHMNCIDSIVEQIELSLLLDDIERMDSA